jgi:LacI family transcriptional regulator, galactose operon repressor
MGSKVDRDKVAQLAGVSSATVSRVFNHPDKVSKEKREIVLQAADKLHYKPNVNASILARGINGKILLLDNNKLLKYDRSNSFYYSWLYVDLLNQIRDVLKDTLYELVISNLEDLKISDSSSLKEFDGIICFDIDNAEDLLIVRDSGVPYVFGHHVRDIHLPNKIFTDNFYGGYLQARFLRDTGHKKVIYITGLLSQLNAHKERYEGFMDVFKKGNHLLIDGKVGKDGGAESIRSVINQIKNKDFTAIAAVNDLTAIGVYFELMNQGFRIPESISIIGYDNLPFTNLLPKRLSTIDLKIGRLYKQAAEHLLNIISGKNSEIHSNFKPSLIRGQTVSKIL